MAVSVASPSLTASITVDNDVPFMPANTVDENHISKDDILLEQSKNADSEKPTSYESDDDNRKLFVGGISWETTEDELRNYFSQWGKVAQCVIKLDRYSGTSRGFGFVTMEHEDCVSGILSVNSHNLNGKKIDPKRAKPSREPRKIFVGGVDPLITEEQLKYYFSTFGEIETIDFPFDVQKGRRKYYVFVTFSNDASARKAVSQEKHEIFGRHCDVKVAVTRDQANRQKSLKRFYMLDSNYCYPGLTGYPYGDMFYQGMDQLCYNYFNYDCYGGCTPGVPTASGYGSMYNNFAPNQFRDLSGSRTNQANISRNPPAAPHNSRLLNSAPVAQASFSNPSLQSQTHPVMNYTNLLGSHLEHHHPTPVTCSFDFGVGLAGGGAGGSGVRPSIVSGAVGASNFAHL